jgi:hypothetical protein
MHHILTSGKRQSTIDQKKQRATYGEGRLEFSSMTIQWDKWWAVAPGFVQVAQIVSLHLQEKYSLLNTNAVNAKAS